jgi:uncharacterized oxidoreductase
MTTVFITGGGSGIGMGLAAAFHARGAKVIIGGRNREILEAVAARHPDMALIVVDVASAQSVADCFAELERTHPGLDTVINNAGIQEIIDFASDLPLTDDVLSREIDINLKGLIRVSAAAIPLLRKQKRARLIHIGSGLCYVPLIAAPIYSATKAAVHSFTISLREQLKSTSIAVIEIIPPVVETNLHRSQKPRPPRALSLNSFVDAAMKGLDAQQQEIPVGLAKVLKIVSRVAPTMFLKIINKQR